MNDTNRTPEQLLELVQNDGGMLDDEQLEKIAGGESWAKKRVICPKCGRTCEVNADAKDYKCPGCGTKLK